MIYLFMTVLSAYAMFLLARAIKAGADGEAWLAGVVFAWSPMLVTRGAGHFSLVAAAPLPLFVLLLIRAHRHRRLRDAAWLGLMVALAFWADVYYAVYCVMLATAYITWRVVQVERRPEAGCGRQARWWAVDVMILSVGGLILALLITGGWLITVIRAADQHSWALHTGTGPHDLDHTSDVERLPSEPGVSWSFRGFDSRSPCFLCRPGYGACAFAGAVCDEYPHCPRPTCEPAHLLAQQSIRRGPSLYGPPQPQSSPRASRVARVAERSIRWLSRKCRLRSVKRCSRALPRLA